MEKVFHKTVECGFYSIFSLPGYLILLIIPGMTIMNSGRILINPAMTVAPFAWEMLLAASNLWTITYKQRKNDKKARWKTIKWFFYWAIDVVRSLTDFRSSAIFVYILVEREFVYSIYFVEDGKLGIHSSSDYYLISAPIPNGTRSLTQQESRPRHVVIVCFPQHPEGVFVR